MQPRLDRALFHHEFHRRVRSHECDRQSVVHNAKYLEMLEVARIEFVRDTFGILMDEGTFVTHDKFFFVRNAIDYFSPARFDEELRIYTRIAKIGKTSVTFEQIMNAAADGRRVIESESVMVHVDPKTNLPIEVPEKYRSFLQKV